MSISYLTSSRSLSAAASSAILGTAMLLLASCAATERHTAPVSTQERDVTAGTPGLVEDNETETVPEPAAPSVVRVSAVSGDPVFVADAAIEYRIPAFVRTPAGALVAFAEKRFGTEPGDPDTGYIQVVYRVGTMGASGPTWQPEVVLCDMPATTELPSGHTCGNPTVVYDRVSQRIIVLMNSNEGDVSLQAERNGMRAVPVGGRRVRVAVSEVVGANVGADLHFSSPVDAAADITSQTQPRDMAWDSIGPGAGIQLADGRLVFPAKGRNIVRSAAGVWSYRGLIGTGAAPPEGTVIELSDGRLMRSDRAIAQYLHTFRRLRSVSLDASHARWTPWSQADQPLTPGHYCRPEVCSPEADTCEAAFEETPPATCTGRPSHVHGALGRLADESLSRLYFVNPGHTQRRSGLAIWLSYDEGETWPVQRDLVGRDQNTGYSAALEMDHAGERGVAILFESNTAGRHSIRFLWASLSHILCGRSEPTGAVTGESWVPQLRCPSEAPGDARIAPTSSASE